MINWTIERMDCLPQAEGKTNVVTTVYWRATAADGDFSAGAYGTCGVTYESGESFTVFDKLTQEQVCDWMWANGVDKDEIEGNLNQQIAVQKNPPLVSPPLPWSQE